MNIAGLTEIIFYYLQLCDITKPRTSTEKILLNQEDILPLIIIQTLVIYSNNIHFFLALLLLCLQIRLLDFIKFGLVSIDNFHLSGIRTTTILNSFLQYLCIIIQNSIPHVDIRIVIPLLN